jgi:hypothetical protein
MRFWLLAALVTGLAFAGAAVPLRRRVGPRALLGAAVGIAATSWIAGFVYLSRQAETDDPTFELVVLSLAIVTASIAGFLAVERIVRNSPIADLTAEVPISALAFVVGAGVGAFVALAFFIPRIG